MDSAYFVDLPGYGYAKVSAADRQRWDQLINSYFDAARNCVLLVQLLDSRHAPSADDMQMLEYLRYRGIPFAAALTKADKLKKSEIVKKREEFAFLTKEFGCRQIILTSSETGLGIEELRAVFDGLLTGEV